MEVVTKRSFAARMIGAARLDITVYEEVEHDTTATGQAALVVTLYAVARAIGGASAGAEGVIAGAVGALIGWAIWAGVTYFIGTRLFDGTADWGEMARTIGFAHSPGILYVAAALPLLGWAVSLGLWIWLLVAGIIAIRQALDFDTGKAIATAGLGWLAAFLFGMLLMMLLGVSLPGMAMS